MKIISAEYIVSAVQPKQYPDASLPEIAFMGRSNVGKSSLINLLVNRKKLAKTSSTPGKTQTINFYLINQSFRLVDLPGYGFTRAPKNVSKRWRAGIGEYFATRENLRAVCQLIDIRHPPTGMDIRVSDWLRNLELLSATILVKTDKIKHNKHKVHKERIINDLSLTAEDTVFLCSKKTRSGRNKVLNFFTYLIE